MVGRIKLDKKLFDDILETVEKINPDIAEGLAGKELKNVEKYIDKVWKSAAASFPPNLFYDGYRRYTPEEVNNLLLKRYDSKTYYELAKTSTFIIQYNFIYKDLYSGTDKKLHCDIRLPYVGKGNIMKIMGINYTVMPIAADPVFSATKNDLFVSLNKRNEKFYRFTYNFICDDLKQSATVVWGNMLPDGKRKKKSKRKPVSSIPNMSSRRRNRTDCCPLALYLFANFGFTKTFEKFGIEAKVVSEEEVAKLEPGKWKICRSISHRVTSRRGTIKKDHEINNLIIALKTNEIGTSLKCVIAAFFYVTDHYPDKVSPEYVDETRQWLILLGYIIFNDDTFAEGLMIQRIINHLTSLDGYIDIVTKENLEEVGVSVETVYDLFIYIIENIQNALLFSNSVTMYNKKFMVLPYLMKDVVASINTFAFHLTRIKPNSLSYTTIYEALKNNVKMDRVIQGPDKHRGTMLVSSSSDNLIYEHTAKVILQSQITDKNSNNVQSSIEDKNIDVSVAEVCSYGNHSKKEPTGRGILNLFANIMPNGMVQRNERLRPLLDETDMKIKKV